MQSRNAALSGRILCAACVGVTAGISVYAYFSLPLLVIFAAVLAFIITAIFEKLNNLILIIICLVSFLGGFTHFHITTAGDEKFLDRYSGRYLTISGKVTDISPSGADKQNIVISTDKIVCLNRAENKKLLVLLTTDTDKTFLIGDKLEFSDIISSFNNKSSHDFDYGTYLKSKGICASFFLSSEYVSVSENSPTFLDKIKLLSRLASDMVRRVIGGTEGEVAAAITLGDKTGFPDDLSDIFAKTGISHIVAVSGMHLSVFISLFFFLASKSRLHYKIRNIIAILLVLFYMVLTGLSPSVVRASIMTICVLLAAILDRKEDILTSFFLSAAIILLLNPYTICSASFLLSYLSLGGILLLAKPIQNILNRITFVPKFIRDITAASFSAWIFTLPAVIIMFGGISVFSVLTNILVVPLVNTVFISSLIALVAGFIFSPAYAAIGFLPRILIKFIIALSKGISLLPYSYINVPRPGLFMLICYAIIVLLFYLKLSGKNTGRAGKITFWTIAGFSILSLTVNALTYSVTFFDVGQGDCALIKTPANHTYLIDTGPSGTSVLSALKSEGINSLDAIFISHIDSDHSGGLKSVLSSIPTKKVIFPRYDILSDKMTGLTDMAMGFGADVEFADRFLSYDLAGISANVIWPSPYNKTSDYENRNSMVLMFDINNADFLFTGDIDTSAENSIMKSGEIIDCDVLKVSHHGSDSAGSYGFLKRTSPEYSLISVGRDNRYGHPDEDLITRLEHSGSRILRTDQMGDIKFRIDLFGNIWLSSGR